ncbi:hypothetical protein BDZ91DRAFT_744880 [Kalaharituber pfeilii]|nr:hypothetical protein BDZ91DRAFT_744880 [Kalaharituber pfeilii]
MTDSIPANLNWVDDVCVGNLRMLAQSGNILYAIGGYVDLLAGRGIANSHLQILNLSQSVDLESDYASLFTVHRLPNTIPRNSWGSFFAHKKKLHLFGGVQTGQPIYERNGTLSYSPRVELEGGLWTYDIETNKWDDRSDSGLGINTASQSARAYDLEGEVGWLYGGGVWTERYRVGTERQGETTSVRELEEMMRVPEVSGAKDVKVGRVQAQNSSTVGGSLQGNMVFIPDVGTEWKGILVLLGGRKEGKSENGQMRGTLRSLESVFVYDIGTHTWFTQPTTAEGNSFPVPRAEACAVVASASDGSSHNLYLYGGYDGDKRIVGDIYILSLPSFHWVKGDKGVENPKVGHACAKVHDKYMVVHRGINHSPTSFCDRYGGIELFDLSTLEWTTKLNVQSESEKGRYEVPEGLYKVIGGNGQGGATFTVPKDGFKDYHLYQMFNVSADSSATTTSKGLAAGVIAGIVIASGASLVIISIVSFKFLPYLLGKINNRNRPQQTQLQ